MTYISSIVIQILETSFEFVQARVYYNLPNMASPGHLERHTLRMTAQKIYRDSTRNVEGKSNYCKWLLND